MQIETVLLVFSSLFFVCILAGKAGNRFGVPALLLFLSVGMFFGSDGLGIYFDNIKVAQRLGTVALSIILFAGGLDTKVSDIKPVLAPGVTLATLGVLVTALATGVALYWVMGDVINRRWNDIYKINQNKQIYLVEDWKEKLNDGRILHK